jgi:hypothetical protein
MKKLFGIASALLASLRPKLNKQEMDSYGQSSLPKEEGKGIMEWLFASLMNAGYIGKAHLIWDTGNQTWDKPILTGVLRDEPVLSRSAVATDLHRPQKNVTGG